MATPIRVVRRRKYCHTGLNKSRLKHRSFPGFHCQRPSFGCSLVRVNLKADRGRIVLGKYAWIRLAAIAALAAGLGGAARAQFFFVSCYNSNTIEEFDPSGNPVILSSSALNRPTGVALDAAGNLYVANYMGNSIIKFDTNGAETAFASGLANPYALAFDQQGNLYAANFNGGNIKKFDSHGNSSTFATTGVNQPVGLAFDAASNLYVANFGNRTIEKFDPSGHGTQFATNTNNVLNGPFGLAFDGCSNLYVANFSGGTIEKFDPAGHATLVASVPGPAGLFFDTETNLYVTGFNTNRITELTPAGVPSLFAGPASGLAGPFFLATQPGFVSPPGHLFLQPAGTNIVLHWGTPASFSLESATSPNGPYTVITNAPSPFTNPAAGAGMFFHTAPAN
jgi:YD repeat-containing protein